MDTFIPIFRGEQTKVERYSVTHPRSSIYSRIGLTPKLGLFVLQHSQEFWKHLGIESYRERFVVAFPLTGSCA